MRSEITLKDISKLSGYSVATVSKAINNAGDISDLTKKKIRELVRLHDYIPNNFAVALRNRKSNTIAVVVLQLDCKLCGILLSEIQREAFKNGFHIIVLQPLICKITMFECLTNIRGRVDGIIIVDSLDSMNNLNYNLKVISKINYIPILAYKIEDVSLNEIKYNGKKIAQTLIKDIKSN